MLALCVACGPGEAPPPPSRPAPADAVHHPPLRPGRPFEGEIARGTRHRHPLHLRAGELLHAVVEQRGVDVRLALLGPRGEHLVEVDGLNGAAGEEHLFAVAATAGIHTLEVRPWSDRGRGVYALRMEPPRPADATDRRRARAQREIEAVRELAAGDAEARRRAIEHARTAVALWELAGEPRFGALARVRLARLEESRGRLGRAAQLYRRALPTLRAAGADADLPAVLNEAGDLLRRLGEAEAARTALEEALERARALGKRREEAVALNNLALLLRTGGEPWLALHHYRRALEIFRQLGDRRNAANTLHNLGVLHNWLGRPEEALVVLRQALEMQRRDGRRSEMAATLTSLGWVELWAGHPERARRTLERALALRTDDRRGRATTLDRLGTVYLELDRPEAALRHYRRALALSTEIGDQRSRSHGLANLATALLEAGRPADALRRFDAAARLAGAESDPSGRAYILLGRGRALRSAGRRHAARRDLGEALELVESLQRAIPADALRSHYLATAHRIYTTLVDLLMELHGHDPTAGWDLRALEVVERSRARSLLARTTVRRGAGPEITKPSPAPLDAAGIRASLPDDDTSLLVYFLGDRRSHLWHVTRQRVTAHELPPRQRLQAGADRLRRLLADGGRNPEGSQAALTAASLSEALLAPVADRLGGGRLLVMADGALQSIPFAALPRPGGGGEPLLAHHRVVAVPSASVWASLVRRAAARAPAPGLLALAAVPRFGPVETSPGSGALATVLDRGSAGTPEPQAPGLERSVAELGLERLPPLPHVRREAAALLRLAPPAATWAALGGDATEEAVGQRIGRYRIVHLATHALIHGDEPELSGVVLAPADGGRPGPGFLRSRDIAELRLSSELVVLSACRTAVGEEVWGEGVLGLPRSFLAAGATSVVVSLWNVHDEATAELMEHLYRGLLRDGLSPAAALRRAQLALRSDPRWRSPYYWAPFVVVGADRPPAALGAAVGGRRLAALR